MWGSAFSWTCKRLLQEQSWGQRTKAWRCLSLGIKIYWNQPRSFVYVFLWLFLHGNGRVESFVKNTILPSKMQIFTIWSCT